MGRVVEVLERLHKRYGPVVRIGPNKACHAYDAIYMDRKAQKTGQFYDSFLVSEASFGFKDNKDAKERRDMLRTFFSRKGVLKLENVIQDTVDRFIVSLSHKVGSPKPIHLQRAFSSVTMEVITAYCFAKRFDAIEYPDYGYPAIIALHGSSRQFCIGQHFPFFSLILYNLPLWALDEQVDEIVRDPNTLEQVEHDTIYHHMLNPWRRSPKSHRRSPFLVLSNPQVKDRLKKQLIEAWPDVDAPMPLEKLEKIPYLSAVAHEALRFSHGVASILPRVLNEPTEIGGVTVPKGTIVHMGHTFVHRNPDIFPDPFTFRPERWLDKESSDLMNYVVAFSKGPRTCLGINLAWAELFLILGNVFRKVDLDIVDTKWEDLSEFEAYLLPKTKGIIKAKVNKVEGVEHMNWCDLKGAQALTDCVARCTPDSQVPHTTYQLPPPSHLTPLPPLSTATMPSNNTKVNAGSSKPAVKLTQPSRADKKGDANKTPNQNSQFLTVPATKSDPDGAPEYGTVYDRYNVQIHPPTPNPNKGTF
ncbi:hypothetical protein NMY22_g12322 [Coprinellus aureogranulatus]|nr:hypothetical protein NMY22_g12322 [Coprinellus aureogranulatus]